MSRRLQELAWHETPLGELTLRRRIDPVSGQEIHEVKLGEEFLMSSLFTAAEEELARRALAELDGTEHEVLVGGLGLGYTARTVLEEARVASLVVVDALAEVIGWHEQGLVPLGPGLTADRRCSLVHGSFFALMSGELAAQDRAGHPVDRAYDAILVDIDHSPRHVLHPDHASLYTPEGVDEVVRRLRPGGVFALWSNDPPDVDYLEVLRTGLVDCRAEVVPFANPLQDGPATNTVYLARRPVGD
ncbi:spermidine synthase [Actinotalea sp. BY-33]|uniref:Spermidine synthase n=1 Tax=Actinotalea soli TaxID=2819234 RepID=A0A939LQZ7_9CELL|nr:spermidine synthase [Actinotalea soli]MBO1750514.1 spermidine synthase [Actinotalea soli]